MKTDCPNRSAILLMYMVILVGLFGSCGQPRTAPPPGPEFEGAAPPASPAAVPPVPGASAAAAEIVETGAPNEWLSLVGQTPLPGQAVSDQIVLFFDAPIAPLEAGAGPLLSVEPPVAGESRVDANVVSWLAETPVAGDVILKVTLNPTLRSTEGKLLDPGQRTLAFAGFVFAPKEAVELESGPDKTVLGVLFPVPVTADGLRGHTTVRGADGASVAFSAEPSTSEEGCRLVLGAGIRWPVAITFAKGVPDASGALRTARDYVYLYPREPFFRVTSVHWGAGDVTTSPLSLTFSSPVPGGALADYVTISEASSGSLVPFTLAFRGENRPEHILLCRTADVKDKTVKVAIREGLPGISHRTLGKPFSVDIAWQRPDLVVKEVHFDPEAQEVSRLHFEFSSPVDPAELRRCLNVTSVSGEETIPFEIENAAANTSLSVLLQRDQPLLQVNVQLSEGFATTDSSVLKAPYARLVRREGAEDEAARLYVQNHWWDTRIKEGATLNVDLNCPPDAQSLREHVTVEPPLENLRVEKESGGRFTVYGDWNSKQDYVLRLSPGLQYEVAPGEKKTLGAPVIYHVKTEEIPAYVGFGYEDKWYFPRRQGAQLPLQSRNVRKAELALGRLFPSNIAVALGRDFHFSEGFEDAWCERIVSKDVSIACRPDRLVDTPLDVDALFPPDKKGVFVLTVTGGEPKPVSDEEDEEGPERLSATRLILWTDIGVLAHWRNQELAVFVHDLMSLAPLTPAKVTVYSAKNQVLGGGNTGNDGMAHLGPFDTSLGAPQLVVVEHQDDYTFLQLESREEGAAEIGADMPAYSREGYDAFLYADRDLYRPGETVHARWIVRTRFSEPAGGVPLLVKVVKPNNTTLLSQTTTLSPLGTGELDIPTEKAYPTGKYTVQLSVPGNAVSIGSYRFSLEEFVPNRIKTEVAVAEERWLAGQDYVISLSAQHLFGAPAASRKCEAGVLLKRQPLETKQWKGFRFDNDSDYVPDRILCGEVQTDAEGKATFKFRYDPPDKVTFPLKAIVVGRVFELGGRAVVGKTELTLFPSETCLGVAASRNAATGALTVDVAAIRADESPADLSSVQVTLEKQVWNYYVRRYYTHHEPRWTESFEPLETKDVSLTNGRGTDTFAVPDYGYYRVRVHSETTRQYSTTSFYAYGDWFEVAESPRPSLIKISLDKESHEVGDEVEVRIESPFDGKGIVVVQGEGIQRMMPVDIKDKVGFVRFRVEEEQCPNVWVEATVIHAVPKERTQVYPFSSFAMANLQVLDSRRRLAVSFPGLPEEIRPAGKAAFVVETLNSANEPVSAEVTLAAVDEGIHSITGYKNPEPYEWLFRPRRPDFRRAHYYDKVAYDFEQPPIGGDGFLQQRVPTIDENWIRPLALWSGVTRTGADGRATVSFDVPEFAGQLRLVAVACNEAALGMGAGNVFVRRPYMLRTSMPRFLLPGDACRCRAVVFNHSDAPCTAVVSWSASGTLHGAPRRVDSEGTLGSSTSSQELAVAAHGEANVSADFAAGSATGQGEIRWDVVIQNAQGQVLERLTEAAPIPVRAPGAFQSQTALTVLKPGETREFRNEVFADDALAEIAVVVGANPLLRLQEALEYVVHYPYGCVEQTTSALMPMYLLRKAGALTQLALDKQDSLESYIQVGIDRLFSMQTYPGGLGTWPYAETPYPYGSVYGLHFLTLVKNDHEFDVPAENFKALQKYVRGLVADWTDASPPSFYLRAYAVYVLALDGDIEAIQQIERFDTVKLPRTARYLLAAALAHSTQDLDRVKHYLASTPFEPYAVREIDGTLNSDVRNKAIELLVLRQTGAEPADVAAIADELLLWIEAHRHGNTQETAFVVSALGAYLGDLADKNAVPAAQITGPAKEGVLSGLEVYEDSHKGPGGVFTVSNTGQTNLYVNVTTRGVPKTIDTKPVSEGGLAVERRLYTPLGALYEEPTYAQGTSYVVHVRLQCSQELKNVVVADILPAGFEVENPRLDPDLLPGGKFSSNVTPTYLDVRDDRVILAFDQLNQGTQDFYYVVRAVTPGRFGQPAIQAECMYDAAIRANGGPRTIEVK